MVSEYLYCGCSIRVFVHNTVFSLSILLGLLQSAGWPTTVAIMGNWFGKGRYVSLSTVCGK